MTSYHSNDKPFNPPPDDAYLPPADLAAEKNVIGALMLDPDALPKVAFLEPNDFYYERLGDAFGVARIRLADELPIFPSDLAPHDNELYTLLHEAYNNCPSSLPIVQWARTVKELARKRRMFTMAGTMAGFAVNGKTPEQITTWAVTELEAINSGGGTTDEWAIRSASSLAAQPKGFEWQIKGLMRSGQVTLIVGATGIKKTLVMMNQAACLATGQTWLPETGADFTVPVPRRVLWIDTDNGAVETELRIRAALLGVGVAVESLGGVPFFYLSEPSPWPNLDDAAAVRRIIYAIRQSGAEVVYLDALGLMVGDVDENSPEMAKIVQALKQIRNTTGASLIPIHHPSKGAARGDTIDAYNAAGSAKLPNFMEQTLEIRTGADDQEIIIHVTKSRKRQKLKQIGARFSFSHFAVDVDDPLDGEMERFSFEGFVPDTTTKTQPKDYVRAALMNHPGQWLTADDIYNIVNPDGSAELPTVSALRVAANRLAENDRHIERREGPIAYSYVG